MAKRNLFNLVAGLVKNESENEVAVTKTAEEAFTDRLYEMVKVNMQKIGDKYYASIPTDCMDIDEGYQRVDTLNPEKVKDLITKWNKEKMDTLLVSDHEEEKRFYIIDGVHRFLAAKENGVENLECEIRFYSGTPEERRIKEADAFYKQQEGVDPMSPINQHKAKVLCGIQAYVDLDEVIKNTNGIQFKTNANRGRQPKGTLTGYSEAAKISEAYGKNFLQDVVDILIEAKWNIVGTGLGNHSFRMVRNVLAAHGSNPLVKAELARVLRGWDPVKFRAVAQGYYVNRKPSNANALYLEDLVCNNLGIERLIDKNVEGRYIA